MISSATNDKKTLKQLHKEIEKSQIAQIEMIVLLYSFFKDYKKVLLWFNTPNLNLGGCEPAELIKRYKHKRVLNFIKSQIKGEL